MHASLTAAAAAAAAAADTERRKYRGSRMGQTYPCLGELDGESPAAEPRAVAPLSDDSEEETLVDLEEEEALAQSRSWTNAQVDTFLLSRTLAPTDVRPLSDLMRPVQGPAGAVAEVLYLVRPLVYALLIRRYVLAAPQRSASAWTPVGTAFALDVLARALRRWSLDPRVPDPFRDPRGWARAVAPSNPLAGGIQGIVLRLVLAVVIGGGGGGAGADAGGAGAGVSPLEADEFSARTAGWGWYLLRGPVWTQATRPRVEGLLGTLKSVPLLGLGASLAEDYLPLVDRYFYFSSR